MAQVGFKQTIAKAYILMFISPPVSLLSSLKSMTFNQRRWLLIIAGTIMGSTFLFGDIGDGIRHYELVKTYYTQISFIEFLDVTWNILTLQSSEYIRGDLYIHLISYIAGGVLSYPLFFWTIVSFIYCYFYISSIFLIYSLYNIRNTTYIFILLFSLFVCLKSFEGIQFVRTWTAFWILFYGVLQYELKQNRLYLVLVFIFPPLIHFGFLALSIPIWAFVFLDTQKKIFKVGLVAVFMLSFFTTLDQARVLEFTTQTELGASRTDSYYRADRTYRPLLELDRLGGRNFYAALHDAKITSFLILMMTISLIISKSYFDRFNSIESKLFSYGLAAQSFSNVTTFLYAVSARSSNIAIIFLMSSIVLYIKRNYSSKYVNNLSQLEKYIIFSSAIFLTYFFLYRFAVIIQWLSAYFLAFPIIPILFEDANMTIRQFLGPVIELLFN